VRGARGKLLRLHQRRQGARYRIQQSGIVVALLLLFLCLDLAPDAPDVAGGFGGLLAEDVRMPRISFSLMASSASAIENRFCSAAICEKKTDCSSRSPSSPVSSRQSRASMASITS